VHDINLITTIAYGLTAALVCATARGLNPQIKVMARVRYLAQGGALEQAGADVVCYDEAEAATALSVVLRAYVKALQSGAPTAAAAGKDVLSEPAF
jgi:hypothetical protein